MTNTKARAPRWKRINPDDPDWFRNARFFLKSGMAVYTNEDGIPVMWSAIVPRPRKKTKRGASK